MRLSAFSIVDPPDPHVPSPSRLPEVVGLARACEQGGLSALWVAEHHFQSGGGCPSPPVLLAACGAVTRTLRLGSMVSVLPYHRPIDVAEEYATLDRLLEGRLNFGVGSGYLATELEAFAVDPARKRSLFDDGLEFILAAFAGRAVRPAGADGPSVRLNVLPAQQPHPPVWIAVQRREAIAHVARKGYSIALVPYATVADRRELAEEIAEYRAQLPPGQTGEVAVALHVYAGDRVAEARTAFARYVRSRHDTGSTFLQAKADQNPRSTSPESIERSGLALFGDVETVLAGLGELESLGIDELLAIFDFGGLSPELVHRSVTTVGRAWADRVRSAA